MGSWRGTLLGLTLVAGAAIPAGPLLAGPAEPVVQPPFERFFEQLFGNRDARRQDLERVEVSWDEERRFGRQAAEAYLADLRRQGIRCLRRGRDVEYLRKLLARIQPRMRQAARYRELTVVLADRPETDARCFPGGTVIVFRGMLEFAENEAALVGVLAHELSHLDHGHQLRHLRAWKLAQSNFQSAAQRNDPARMMQGGLVLAGQFARPFAPEDELQADEDSARWSYAIGYDPRELAELMRRMHDRDRGAGDWIPPFFRTHPVRLDRYEAVQRLYRELQTERPRADLIVGPENLARRQPARLPPD